MLDQTRGQEILTEKLNDIMDNELHDLEDSSLIYKRLLGLLEEAYDYGAQLA